MDTSKKLKLKLLVDKEKKKVIFAESDKYFVDILFSFLTMPLGSVIHILNKQSSLGCIDNLYESIQNLEQSYFSSEACKEMLLRPLNACGWQCEDLILRIDESNPRTFFTCRKKECHTNSKPLFSSVPKTSCPCGQTMDFNWYWKKKEQSGPDADGVFLRGMENFIISEDLVVVPASTMNMQTLIEKHGIRDLDHTEEICINMGAIMFRDFLRRSLVAEFPLSSMCFRKTNSTENPQFISEVPKIEESLIDKVKKVKAKIFICKSTDKVLYAEAAGDFADLLFNVLTFPLGTIVELLNKSSSVGCLDNLYKSVEKLSSEDEGKYLKPNVSELLLHPKLAPHFSPSNSLFSVSEKSTLTGDFPGCHTCLLNKSYTLPSCEHGMKLVPVNETNPKLSSAEVGGSYAKLEVKFLITDDLQVKPFSSFCSIQTLRKCKASFAALEEKEIDIDQSDALKLLKSCLTSKNPLSDVFLPKLKKKKVSNWERA